MMKLKAILRKNFFSRKHLNRRKLFSISKVMKDWSTEDKDKQRLQGKRAEPNATSSLEFLETHVLLLSLINR